MTITVSTSSTSDPQISDSADSQSPVTSIRDEAAAHTRRFDDKVVLLTGASDRGLGGAIAERLAAEGATLALTSLDQPRNLLKRLDRIGGDVSLSIGDLTDTHDAQRIVGDCLDRFGEIDVLINNAGIEECLALDKMTEEQWENIIDVNLKAAIRVTRAALPHITIPQGCIVNVSSALAFGGCTGFSVYSASKAGLNGFTQSLAWELGPQRIRVVGVAPGFVPTPMTFKYVQQREAADVKQLLAGIDACHPMDSGTPYDVAAAVAFLASDEARWITGVTLPLGWAPHFNLPMQSYVERD